MTDNGKNRIESDDERLVKFLKSDNNTKVNVLEFHKHPLFLKLNQSELQNKVYYYDNGNNYYFCKFNRLEEIKDMSKVNAEPNEYNVKTINKIVFDVYWIKNDVNDEWRKPDEDKKEKELKFNIKLIGKQFVCDGICDLYDVSDFDIKENVNPSEINFFKRKKIAENLAIFENSFPRGGKKTKKFSKPKYKYSKKRYNKSQKNKSYKKK
jgi:hypothetical protein